MHNSVSSVTSDTGLRLCSRCLRPRPIAEFRRRRKNQPHRQRICSACHAVTSREYRAAKRSRRVQATVRRLVCDLKAATTSEHVGLLVAMVERELGGAERLAEEWMAHFHAASLNRGGRRICDFFAAVMRLSVSCSELHPKPDFDRMSDVELREERDRLLGELLVEKLPIVFESLRDQGWTISPPDRDFASESILAASSTAS